MWKISFEKKGHEIIVEEEGGQIYVQVDGGEKYSAHLNQVGTIFLYGTVKIDNKKVAGIIPPEPVAKELAEIAKKIELEREEAKKKEDEKRQRQIKERGTILIFRGGDTREYWDELGRDLPDDEVVSEVMSEAKLVLDCETPLANEEEREAWRRRQKELAARVKAEHVGDGFYGRIYEVNYDMYQKALENAAIRAGEKKRKEEEERRLEEQRKEEIRASGKTVVHVNECWECGRWEILGGEHGRLEYSTWKRAEDELDQAWRTAFEKFEAENPNHPPLSRFSIRSMGRTTGGADLETEHFLYFIVSDEYCGC